MAIYCTQCGTSFPDDFNFCLTCGKRLKVDPWRLLAVFDRVHLKAGYVPDFISDVGLSTVRRLWHDPYRHVDFYLLERRAKLLRFQLLR